MLISTAPLPHQESCRRSSGFGSLVQVGLPGSFDPAGVQNPVLRILRAAESGKEQRRQRPGVWKVKTAPVNHRDPKLAPLFGQDSENCGGDAGEPLVQVGDNHIWQPFPHAVHCRPVRLSGPAGRGAAPQLSLASMASTIRPAALTPSNRSNSTMPVGDVTLISVRHSPITSMPTNI